MLNTEMEDEMDCAFEKGGGVRRDSHQFPSCLCCGVTGKPCPPCFCATAPPPGGYFPISMSLILSLQHRFPLCAFWVAPHRLLQSCSDSPLILIPLLRCHHRRLPPTPAMKVVFLTFDLVLRLMLIHYTSLQLGEKKQRSRQWGRRGIQLIWNCLQKSIRF